jgi:hypothetical protein|tara:strand:- start:179 stop:352 length:174 start_codon:yes stop_codon:yes gene_type:complete
MAIDDITAANTQRRFMLVSPEVGKSAESKTVLTSNGLTTPILAVSSIKAITEITWNR